MAKKKNKETTKSIELLDIDSLGEIERIEVKVNNKLTDLQIGDKIIFPQDSEFIKTVISLTIFEDGSINYLLKWYDGEFKQELVSVNDLKLLNICDLPRRAISMSADDPE